VAQARTNHELNRMHQRATSIPCSSDCPAWSGKFILRHLVMVARFDSRRKGGIPQARQPAEPKTPAPMRVCPFASPRSDKQFRELAHGEIVVNYQNNWQGLCHRWKSGCVGTRYPA
jgi:hypothetical protein